MFRLFLLAAALSEVVFSNFPPEDFAKLELARAYKMSSKFYYVILSTEGLNVTHVDNLNGNRLKTTDNHDAQVFIMYMVNKGYVLQSKNHRDFLCVNDEKTFKLLNNHKNRHMPANCVLYFESTNVNSNTTELKYCTIENELQVCQSDIDLDYTFKIYHVINNQRLYLNISNYGIGAVEKSSTLFSIQYEKQYNEIKCIEKIACFLQSFNYPCASSEMMKAVFKENRDEIIKISLLSEKTTPKPIRDDTDKLMFELYVNKLNIVKANALIIIIQIVIVNVYN
uniref:ADOR110 n=1 Tax=Adoxophyes orana granulovirus TaxID=170617 RepID=A0A0A7V521_GVAO|nr:ADOR110 [Adoxophyes orana granulovirus]